MGSSKRNLVLISVFASCTNAGGARWRWNQSHARRNLPRPQRNSLHGRIPAPSVGNPSASRSKIELSLSAALNMPSTTPPVSCSYPLCTHALAAIITTPRRNVLVLPEPSESISAKSPDHCSIVSISSAKSCPCRSRNSPPSPTASSVMKQKELCEVGLSQVKKYEVSMIFC